MTNYVNITLFHAKWFGHCVAFAPEWEKFKQKIKDGNIRKYKVTTSQYEDNELEAKSSIARIQGLEIKGYPTIKITIATNKTKTNIIVRIRPIHLAFKKLLFSRCFNAILKARINDIMPLVAANNANIKPKDRMSRRGLLMISKIVPDMLSYKAFGSIEFKNSIINTSS